jgi:hypothetical protein
MTGVVIASNLVLSDDGNNLNADSPIIGYENLVTASNVTATTEDQDYPASNLANPSTSLLWRSAAGSPSSPEYITVILDTEEQVDYLAIARHNFGTGFTPVSVEGLSSADGSPLDWFELVSAQLLPNNGPVIFRFTKQSLYAVRLKIHEAVGSVSLIPELAVMYVGELLSLQRRIYVGHTPFPLAREIQVANHRSVSGAFLGRIVLSSTRKTGVSLQNLTPSWYRLYFDPFLIAAQEIPFFFAWRPGDYPLEVGYCWLTGDPRPSNQRGNGMMSVDMELEGVA